MDDYENLSHSKWECKYDGVFIPKYRRKTLYGELRQHLGEVFRRLAIQKESWVEDGHLMPDHVHMMISIQRPHRAALSGPKPKAPGFAGGYLLRFRHFIDGSLALASLNRACRDHRPDASAALTTVAFDQSGPRWLGISDLIAEPEGPTFISYKVARSRLDRLRFVTQDPTRSLAALLARVVRLR